ncbi:MAG: 50S ribosomal protein L11 methyltransferase [Myxococcota bacterium]
MAAPVDSHAVRYPFVHVDVPAELSELVALELWEQGAKGIEERDAGTLERPEDAAAEVTLVAAFEDEEEARRVALEFGRKYPSRLAFVTGDAWRDAWREHFKPVRIGQRLVVRPSWERVRLWPGEVEVVVDPGRAFGSGTHDTTRLVLREVDRRVRGGERVLDVGCGSGILGVAALRLGAASVRAVDVDADAVPVARENARINRVASRMTVSATPVERLRGRYDLVLANIETVILEKLAPAIAARVAPHGTLVLSGVLVGEQARIDAAFPGFQRVLLGRSGEWVAPVLRPRRGAGE